MIARAVGAAVSPGLVALLAEGTRLAWETVGDGTKRSCAAVLAMVCTHAATRLLLRSEVGE